MYLKNPGEQPERFHSYPNLKWDTCINKKIALGWVIYISPYLMPEKNVNHLLSTTSNTIRSSLWLHTAKDL